MEAYILCDICLSTVSQQSYELHRLHCEKNTIECPSCRIKIKKQDLDHHFSTTHALKHCQHCSLEFEIRFLQAHKCPRRPKLCEFCAAFFPKDQISDHKIECGSRTEQCERCLQYIRLSELKSHSELPNCREIIIKRKELEQEKIRKKEKDAKLKQKSKTIAYLEERKAMGRAKRQELDRKKGINSNLTSLT